MEAVAYCDNAIEPIRAVKSVRHRKHDDRQQEDEIEEDFAAAAFRRVGEPPMMAEPKHACHDKADHQRDDRLSVGIYKVYPYRCAREPAGLRQIIGEQRHRNAENGVAQRLQSAHFEKTDLLQPRSPSKPSDIRGAEPLETRPSQPPFKFQTGACPFVRQYAARERPLAYLAVPRPAQSNFQFLLLLLPPRVLRL